MKKLIYLLPILLFTFMAMVNTSCRDELEPDVPEEEALVVPTDTSYYFLEGVLPGLAVYDTVFNCVAIQIDTDLKKIRGRTWDIGAMCDTLKVENVRFVPVTNFQPYFDVVPNSRFFFQIRSLCEELRHYTPETKTGYFMISIKDSTLSRSCLPDSDTGIDLLSYFAGNKRIADSENKIQTVPFAI